MIRVHQLICTCLGIGYIGKGSGTIAALAAGVIWYLFCINGSNVGMQVAAVLGFTVLGVWSAGKVEAGWGKDSNRVVIDEVAGMCLSLLLVPVYLKYVIVSFVLFRFFDIAKPFFIRRLEALPGGWGVMADDLLAGLYTNIIVQVIVITKIF